MKRGALLDLLTSPTTIVQVAVFAPLAVIMLFVAAALRPGTAVAAASIACAGFGLFVGQGIRAAARCPLSWTLPGFRRALLQEFVVGGLAVSGLATAITIFGGAGVQQTAPVFAVGFASFALGAVSLLAPEWTQLLVLAYIIVVPRAASGRAASAAIQSAPLATAMIAAVVSMLTLWCTFGRRAIRWSALTGPRQSGRSIWHEWPTLAWWRRPHARITRGAARAAPPVRYAGTSVLHGALATYRAVRPVAWLALPFVFLLCLAAVGSSIAKPAFTPFGASWIVLAFTSWMGASWSPRPTSQLTLQWPRRHHADVAYVRDLADAALFLLLMLAASALVGGLDGLRGTVLRGLAVMAIFLPAIRWVTGPPVGERWTPHAVAGLLSLLGIVVFLVALNLVVTHLPALVSSGAAQAVLLGSLVLLSQALHWRSLRRYLMTRDLVGGSM